jgi:hypothetical protein
MAMTVASSAGIWSGDAIRVETNRPPGRSVGRRAAGSPARWITASTAATAATPVSPSAAPWMKSIDSGSAARPTAAVHQPVPQT